MGHARLAGDGPSLQPSACGSEVLTELRACGVHWGRADVGVHAAAWGSDTSLLETGRTNGGSTTTTVCTGNYRFSPLTVPGTYSGGLTGFKSLEERKVDALERIVELLEDIETQIRHVASDISWPKTDS